MSLTKYVAISLVLLGLLTGCASKFSWVDPKADLQRRKFFYVDSELSDGKNLHQAIAAELRNRGYAAGSGYLTMMPKEADVLVSYQSRWAWDFATYLIELDITVRDVRSGRIIATSGYHRPATEGTSTEEVIRKTLSAIFIPKPEKP
jgi:hypothetical protein